MSKPLTLRERMAMERVPMPAREPDARSKSFEEVNLGLTAQMAKLEAMRCLECRRPTCIEGCPVGVQIDRFILHVAEGDFSAAGAVIAQDNLLPAICGRVCPQETQCEGACVLSSKHRPIAIGHLERFVADYLRSHELESTVEQAPATGHRVAVVGSGPSGLACAADLARSGHEVTVFEALHEPGGVLVYGIPEFRLPKEVVDAEIAGLERLGVVFETNAVIGRTYTLDDLLSSYEAVFIGVGAGLPSFLGVPGESLIGVYSANEFLTRVNLMQAYLAGAETPVLPMRDRDIVVFGGGNSAMDAARTALRMGAGSVTVVYRRSQDELPAREEEVRHAREEGIRFEYLASPLALDGDEEGRLTGVRLQRMTLGDADESGRRRPMPVAGSEFALHADLAIIAVGNQPNPLLLSTCPQLERSAEGTLVVDEETGRTSMQGVFAGGDIVTGGATVIRAMGAGRVAAESIQQWLATREWGPPD